MAMNYAAHNRELHGFEKPGEPVFFMKPDTAILKNGKPFFLPDFSTDMQYETEIVVQIDRLGKNISRRFAHRYFHDITVGIDMTARDLQRRVKENGLPWELSKAFDYSAIIGDFIPIDELKIDINNLDFHLDIDGNTVQKGNTAEMLFKIDEIIEYVSRYITLRTGDLLFTGTPSDIGNVFINNHLQGYIEDRKLLDFYIK
jgi:2-keto-4-pentenoate hydratase/2-oxohepta-3-ene-1,7-dioic acid hydratase in catechol pathway